MNKKYLIAVAILLAGLVVGYVWHGSTAPVPVSKEAPASTQAGDATVSNYPTWYNNGVAFGSAGKITNIITGTIGVGADQATWLNNTGGPVAVKLAWLYPVATSSGATAYASSTMLFSIGTTSAATVDEFANPLGTLVDNFSWATGTKEILIDNVKDGGTSGQGEIIVNNGVFVYWLVRAGTGAGAVCSITTTACETSTSTNRGFNLKYFLDYIQL